MDLQGLLDLLCLHLGHLFLAYLYQLERDHLYRVGQQVHQERLYQGDQRVLQELLYQVGHQEVRVDHDLEDLRVGLDRQLLLLLEDQQVDHDQEVLKVGLDLVGH